MRMITFHSHFSHLFRTLMDFTCTANPHTRKRQLNSEPLNVTESTLQTKRVPVGGDKAVVVAENHFQRIMQVDVDPVPLDSVVGQTLVREDIAFLVLNHLRRWCQSYNQNAFLKKQFCCMNGVVQLDQINHLALGFDVRTMRRLLGVWGATGAELSAPGLKILSGPRISAKRPTAARICRRPVELVVWSFAGLSCSPAADAHTLIHPWHVVPMEHKKAQFLQKIPRSLWKDIIGEDDCTRIEKTLMHVMATFKAAQARAIQ